jgi:hypothetical protein
VRQNKENPNKQRSEFFALEFELTSGSKTGTVFELLGKAKAAQKTKQVKGAKARVEI